MRRNENQMQLSLHVISIHLQIIREKVDKLCACVSLESFSVPHGLDILQRKIVALTTSFGAV